MYLNPQVLPLLDRAESVDRYAWFSTRNAPAAWVNESSLLPWVVGDWSKRSGATCDQDQMRWVSQGDTPTVCEARAMANAGCASPKRAISQSGSPKNCYCANTTACNVSKSSWQDLYEFTGTAPPAPWNHSSGTACAGDEMLWLGQHSALEICEAQAVGTAACTETPTKVVLYQTGDVKNCYCLNTTSCTRTPSTWLDLHAQPGPHPLPMTPTSTGALYMGIGKEIKAGAATAALALAPSPALASLQTGAPYPPHLAIKPCSSSDRTQTWAGATLSAPNGSPSTLTNAGSADGTCLGCGGSFLQMVPCSVGFDFVYSKTATGRGTLATNGTGLPSESSGIAKLCPSSKGAGMCLDAARLNDYEPFAPGPHSLYYNQSFQQVDYLTPYSGAGDARIRDTLAGCQTQCDADPKCGGFSRDMHAKYRYNAYEDSGPCSLHSLADMLSLNQTYPGSLFMKPRKPMPPGGCLPGHAGACCDSMTHSQQFDFDSTTGQLRSLANSSNCLALNQTSV